MRQKYLISKMGSACDLTIEEYAVIGNLPRQMQKSPPMEDEYTLLCQESYKGKVIEESISGGTNDLIASLRTDNLFPNQPTAAKIAESVMSLYRSSGNHSAELIIDDVDLLDGT